MNRQLISDFLYKTLYYLLIVSWIVLIVSFLFVDGNFNDIGKLMGKTAVTLLWIVSIPGILKRFQVKGLLQSVQIILMRSRRRLGDLMFTFALMHVCWVRVFLYINYTHIPSLSEFPTFELLGIAALTLLVPMFATSNNYSVQKLKKNWHRIHYAIYIIMWLVAFHIYLQGNLLFSIPTFVIAILQALSRINEWRLKGKVVPAIQVTQPTQPVQPPQQTQQPQS